MNPSQKSAQLHIARHRFSHIAGESEMCENRGRLSKITAHLHTHRRGGSGACTSPFTKTARKRKSWRSAGSRYSPTPRKATSLPQVSRATATTLRHSLVSFPKHVHQGGQGLTIFPLLHAAYNHEHVGRMLGAAGPFEGLVRSHPFAKPKAVSSIAASKASPQLASLATSVSRAHQSESGQYVPGAAARIVEPRANIMREAVLGVGIPDR